MKSLVLTWVWISVFLNLGALIILGMYLRSIPLFKRWVAKEIVFNIVIAGLERLFIYKTKKIPVVVR